jgi:hypothetical protein
MPRPHICFLQSQDLDWQPLPPTLVTGAPVELSAKMLSIDDADAAAATLLVRVPSGGRFDWPVPPRRYLEILMLEGSLKLAAGAQLPMLGAHGYARLEGGAMSGNPDRVLHWSSIDGAIALVMTGSSSQSHADVLIPDTYTLPWLHGAAGTVTGKPLSPELATKILFRDSVSAEQSFLYCAMPQHPPPAVMPGKFTHPVIEEIFTLSGSYVFGDVGRMERGGYVFWRENVWHGPTGSETGYCLFIRVIGGPLKNQFSTKPAPFSWRPSYRPCLPAGLLLKARGGAEEVHW